MPPEWADDREQTNGRDEPSQVHSVAGAHAQHFEHLFTHASHAIYIISSTGHLAHANPRAWANLGYEPAELPGLTFWELVANWSPSDYQTIWCALANGQEMVFDGELCRKDGQRFAAQLHASKGDWFGTPHIFCMVEDISLQRIVEARLQQRNFELQVLHDLSARIGYTLDYADLIHMILENLHRVIPHDVAVGLALAQQHAEWVCLAAQPLAPDLQQSIKAQIQAALAQLAFPVDPRPLIPPTWTMQIRQPGAPLLTRLQSVFMVPFLTNDTCELVGLLMVGAQGAHHFGEEQIRLLYTVARQAIASIQRLRALRTSEQQGLEDLVGNLPVGVVLLDATYHIRLTNPLAEVFLSMLPEVNRTAPLTRLGSLELETLLATHASQEVTTAPPQARVLRVTGSHVASPASQTGGWVLVLDDITEQRQAAERIRYMALYDPLTDLPNRVLFHDRLQQAMVQARSSGQLAVIMFLDLDRFKAINDTLGHAFGDQLLQAVARRICECVRPCDTVARLGGDEFTVILQDMACVQDATLVAQQILATLAQPITLDGHDIYTSASIGITFYPADANDTDSLIKQADVAMYRAKKHGRNGYAFYTADMHAHTLERLTLEMDLRRSIEQDQFFLVYQPQFDIQTRQIVGVEALARWQHPERGLVAPNAFISIAEETGLIEALGLWIVRTACNQHQAWRALGLDPLRIAVNLSARQIGRDEFVDEVAWVLQETGMDPGYLELELTESMIMHDTEQVVGRIQRLRALGVRFAIDDFGTGYSSLSHLRRLPIDTLKIDRSFVRDIPTDRDCATIAMAIIAMAHSLNLRVTAEGVEREPQEAFLRQQGCDELQGFLYGRPVEAPEIAQLLQIPRPADRSGQP